MQKLIKACGPLSAYRKKGAVSIMLVIIIPVFIMGCLVVYQMLYQRQMKLRTEKIALACSDAYLSVYNGYLYDELAILAIKKSPGIDALIREYLIKNRILDANQALLSTSTYMTLDQPIFFREAIRYASEAQIGRAIVHLGEEWLDQLSSIQTIRKYLKNYHSLLEKIADISKMMGIEDFLELLEKADDREFLNGVIALEARCASELEKLTAISGQVRTIGAQIKGETAWEKAFIESQEAILLDAVDLAMDEIDEIRKIVEDFEDFEDFEVVDNKKGIRALVSDRITYLRARNQKARSGWLEALQGLIIEAEKYAFKGEATERKLILPKPLNTYEILFDLPQLSVTDRWLINEYLLMIFNSYDENCPRKLKNENRNNQNRALKGEVEFLLTGESDESNSLSLVRLKLLALREGANLLGIITSKERMEAITKSTLAIPSPWNHLAVAAAIGGWATVESYYDVKKLVAGEGLHLIKTPDEWSISFEQLLVGQLPPDMKRQTTPEKSFSDPRLYYQDYLRILLYFQEDRLTLSRTMALVDSELWWASDKKATLAHYAIGFDLQFAFAHYWGETVSYQLNQAIHPLSQMDSVFP